MSELYNVLIKLRIRQYLFNKRILSKEFRITFTDILHTIQNYPLLEMYLRAN